MDTSPPSPKALPAPDQTVSHPVPAHPVPAPPVPGAEIPAGGLLDRTLDNIRTAWRDIAASALGMVGTLRHVGVSDEDRWREQIQDCLAERGGEVSARARAADLGRTFLTLEPSDRLRFLRVLARDFDVDRAAVDAAMDGFRAASGPVERGESERVLRRLLQPGRMRLLSQFNVLSDGVKFLVELRAGLLEHALDDPLLMAVEKDLEELLRGWFDIGFLDLRRITWDSPAALLEKLMIYEAVHAIDGWRDLKNRLDSDRRCFAFFHPRMPDEPLIFVEVALVRGMADSIHTLLDETAPVDDPGQADTAIFYSISNAQKGLAGISFGGFLIKRVVNLLATEFPNLKQFATLSPVPGFRDWLEAEMRRAGDGLISGGERQKLAKIVPEVEASVLRAGLAIWDGTGGAEFTAILRPILMRLGARYLLTIRDGQRALDPVAHFHLSNGARVERLNWGADRSPKGVAQSYGLMVNYAYRPSSIEINHEAYRGNGKIISSPQIKLLLKTYG